jgi:hypothetical protein
MKCTIETVQWFDDRVTTVDITAPRLVQVSCSDDGKVIWVNIDGLCVLRACRIGDLTFDMSVEPFTAGNISKE